MLGQNSTRMMAPGHSGTEYVMKPNDKRRKKATQILKYLDKYIMGMHVITM